MQDKAPNVTFSISMMITYAFFSSFDSLTTMQILFPLKSFSAKFQWSYLSVQIGIKIVGKK